MATPESAQFPPDACTSSSDSTAPVSKVEPRHAVLVSVKLRMMASCR